MRNDEKYKFIIDADYSPATIPMLRLAEYMTQVAILLGNQEHVHFEKLEVGSTVLVNSIDFVARPKVVNRLNSVKHDNQPEDALKAINCLNDMLRDDNATGELLYGTVTIMPFLGKNIPRPEKLGPFNTEGKLDGVLVRIGGKDETVHATLISADSNEWKCNVDRATAKEMAHYLFGQTLRVYGTGRWERDEFGKWVLLKFTVSHFNKLDEKELTEAVKALQQIKGSGWEQEEDPIGILDLIRKGPDEIH